MPILLKHQLAGVLRVLRPLFPRAEGEVDCVLDRLSGDLLFIFIVEGQNSRQQQIGDDAERPHINFFAVGFLKKHLGGHIGKCAEGVQTCLGRPNNLGQAEVNYLAVGGVRVVIHKNVLWL